MRRIILYLLCIQLQLAAGTASNDTVRYTVDPLELNWDWEVAIHHVLLANDSAGPLVANETTESTEQLTTIASEEATTILASDSLNTSSFEIATDATPISVSSTPSTSTPIEHLRPKIIIEEEKEKDDYEDEEKAESNAKTAEISPKATEAEAASADEDADDNGEDEELDNSPRGRADRLRPILQESLANNPLKRINVTANSTEAEIWSSWAKFINIVSQESSILMRSVLTPMVTETFYEVPDLSTQCSSALMDFGSAMQRNEIWALKMLDSNGRFPVGFFSGTSASWGDFDQCLSVTVLDQEQEVIVNQGKYCLLEFSYPVPQLKPGQRLRFDDSEALQTLLATLASETELKLDAEVEATIRKLVFSFYSTKIYNGICIPKSCTGIDMEILTKAFLGSFFQVNVTNCIVQQRAHPIDVEYLNRWELLVKNCLDFLHQLDQFQRISLITLSVCIALVALATFLDLAIFTSTILDDRKSNLIAIFTRAFSVRSNWNKLFTVGTTRQYSLANPDLRFINGMRVLAMLWIVFIHVAILGTLAGPMLVYRYEEEARPFGRSLAMQFVYNGYSSVEVFFFLSGFVLVFLTLRNRDAKARGHLLRVPSLSLYIGIRAIRLLIPMVGVMSLHFLWPLLGSGPMFGKFTGQLLDACRNNYWKNFLLISNYDKTDDICLVHTWFLSADFQLHLLAYPLVVLLSLNEALGILANVALIFGGSVVSAVLHYQRHPTPTLSAFLEGVAGHFLEDNKYLYYPTHMHLSSYFVGFLLGYLLLKRINSNSNCFPEKQKLKVLPSSKFSTQESRRKNIYFGSLTMVIFAIGAAAIFGAYAWSRDGGALVSNEKLGSGYFGFHRLVFILVPVWVVWLCIRFPKNPIAGTLSTRPMQILSRLSFGMYLVHILVVWYFVLTTRTFIRFNFPDLLFMTGGVLLYSIPLSIAFHFIFEAPWTILMKHFQSQLVVPKKKSKPDIEEQQETSHTDSYELYIGSQCRCSAVPVEALQRDGVKCDSEHCQRTTSADSNGNYASQQRL